MLQRTEKRVGLFTGIGGPHQAKVRSVPREDGLIAASFAPCDEASHDVVKQAADRGAKVIANSESRIDPLARIAPLSLVLRANVSPGLPTIVAPSVARVEGRFVEMTRRFETLHGLLTRRQVLFKFCMLP